MYGFFAPLCGLSEAVYIFDYIPKRRWLFLLRHVSGSATCVTYLLSMPFFIYYLHSCIYFKLFRVVFCVSMLLFDFYALMSWN